MTYDATVPPRARRSEAPPAETHTRPIRPAPGKAWGDSSRFILGRSSATAGLDVPSPGQVVTVLVADGQPLARAGVIATIDRQPDLRVVAAVDDGVKALHRIRNLAPAVALLEVRMPRLGGLPVLEAVRAERLPSRVVLIATRAIGGEVHDAMAAGAAGYLTKRESLDTICDALREAADGREYLSAESQSALVDQIRMGHNKHALLSLRELEILRLTAEGVTSAGIGRRLHLSQSTVKNHLQNLYAKLGVHNAPAAIYQAMRRGLLR